MRTSFDNSLSHFRKYPYFETLLHFSSCCFVKQVLNSRHLLKNRIKVNFHTMFLQASHHSEKVKITNKNKPSWEI